MMKIGKSAASMLLFGLSLSFAIPANAGSAKIALTFDDLPALTTLNDQPYVNYLNDEILRGLNCPGIAGGHLA